MGNNIFEINDNNNNSKNKVISEKKKKLLILNQKNCNIQKKKINILIYKVNHNSTFKPPMSSWDAPDRLTPVLLLAA